MQDLLDEDGDCIILSEEDKAQIQEDINEIDAKLRSSTNSAQWRALQHERRQLVAELAAGQRLPMHDDTSISYDYEIIARAEESGDGWLLRLLRNGEEVGGGIFPVQQDTQAADKWWNGLDEAARTKWLTRATLPTVAEAYLVHLRDEAWHDAAQTAGEWLDSRVEV
ncbi:hypothetical protein LPN04_29620 [Rugamonas sp. A1-17]|nr:hypothetical protein [Rugamonas sp. A1-17]